MNYNSTLSAYAYNIAQGYQLGDEYMRLSIEALKEDDREIRLRRLKNCLIERLEDIENDKQKTRTKN